MKTISIDELLEKIKKVGDHVISCSKYQDKIYLLYEDREENGIFCVVFSCNYEQEKRIKISNTNQNDNSKLDDNSDPFDKWYNQIENYNNLKDQYIAIDFKQGIIATAFTAKALVEKLQKFSIDDPTSVLVFFNN